MKNIILNKKIRFENEKLNIEKNSLFTSLNIKNNEDLKLIDGDFDTKVELQEKHNKINVLLSNLKHDLTIKNDFKVKIRSKQILYKDFFTLNKYVEYNKSFIDRLVFFLHNKKTISIKSRYKDFNVLHILKFLKLKGKISKNQYKKSLRFAKNGLKLSQLSKEHINFYLQSHKVQKDKYANTSIKKLPNIYISVEHKGLNYGVRLNKKTYKQLCNKQKRFRENPRLLKEYNKVFLNNVDDEFKNLFEFQNTFI